MHKIKQTLLLKILYFLKSIKTYRFLQASISKLLNPRSKRNVDHDYKITFGSVNSSFKGLIQDPRANGFRLFFSKDDKNEGKFV